MNDWEPGDVIVHVPTGDARTLAQPKDPHFHPEGGWWLTDGSGLSAAVIEQDEWRAASEVCADFVNLSNILGSPSVRDLEMKVRAGVVTLRAVMGDQAGGTPAIRLIAALILNALLGDANEMPTNYRTFEWHLTPAGEPQVSVHAELIHVGGRSSHDLRRDLEQICDMYAAGDPTAPARHAAYLQHNKMAPRT